MHKFDDKYWMPNISSHVRLENITPVVRETGVSRHHGDPIEGPLENPRISQHYRIEKFKGSPHHAEKIYFNQCKISSVIQSVIWGRDVAA